MRLKDIREFPTTIDAGGNRIHESVLRSYQIVLKTRELLEQGTPPELVIEIMDDLMAAEHSDHKV